MARKTVSSILDERDVPAVAIDEHGLFFFVNTAFEETYGWKADELIGKLITTIMPPHMRDAHNFGFSRFLATETPRIMGRPLTLPVRCGDGRTVQTEQYIVGEKVGEVWRFAATISPKGHA